MKEKKTKEHKEPKEIKPNFPLFLLFSFIRFSSYVVLYKNDNGRQRPTTGAVFKSASKKIFSLMIYS